MSTQHVAEQCCRCGLTGEIMRDPVIVITENDPCLVCGASYEREDLAKYIETEGKDRAHTLYVQNTILKRLLDDYWKHTSSSP
jgi:hypothetical protein